MIVFAHTKFSLVRIQRSEVKRGRNPPPPRSERVFEIPVQVGLRPYFRPFGVKINDLEVTYRLTCNTNKVGKIPAVNLNIVSSSEAVLFNYWELIKQTT